VVKNQWTIRIAADNRPDAENAERSAVRRDAIVDSWLQNHGHLVAIAIVGPDFLPAPPSQACP